MREILRSPRIQGSSADTSRNKKRYDCGLSFPIKRSSRFNHIVRIIYILGFPDGLDDKESTCIAGELSSIPGSGRSPGEGNGYSIIYLSICIFGHIMLDLSSLTRIELRPLTVKAHSPNHWTTKEFPEYYILNLCSLS